MDMLPFLKFDDIESACLAMDNDGVLCSAEGTTAVFLWHTTQGPVPSGNPQADAADRLQESLYGAASAMADQLQWKGRDGGLIIPSRLFDCQYEYGSEPKLTATPTRAATMAAIGGEIPTTLSGHFKMLAKTGIVKHSAFDRLMARAIDALAPKEAVAATVAKDFEAQVIPIMMARISRAIARIAMAASVDKLGSALAIPAEGPRSVFKP